MRNLKARNIPIKQKLRKKGAPNTQPLRSSLHPLGFPWLKGLNKVKVEAANALCEFSSRLAKLCNDFSVLFTIENPANSPMWETPFFRGLVISMSLMRVNVVQSTRKQPQFRQILVPPDFASDAWATTSMQGGKFSNHRQASSFDTAKKPSTL